MFCGTQTFRGVWVAKKVKKRFLTVTTRDLQKDARHAMQLLTPCVVCVENAKSKSCDFSSFDENQNTLKLLYPGLFGENAQFSHSPQAGTRCMPRFTSRASEGPPQHNIQRDSMTEITWLLHAIPILFEFWALSPVSLQE